MSPEQHVSGFGSIASRENYLQRYDAALRALWPEAATSCAIQTAWGSVAVHQVGPMEAAPLVILGGSGQPAPYWHTSVTALRWQYRVVVIDMLGEVGLSVQSERISGASDAVGWLDSALNQLGLQGAELMGSAEGARLLLEHQLETGQHSPKLTLIEPAGFHSETLGHQAWRGLGIMGAALPQLLRGPVASATHHVQLREPALAALELANTGFVRKTAVLPQLTDEQLQSLRVPTTVLLGESSTRHPSAAVHERLRQGNVHSEVVQGTGHALVLERPDLVSAAVLRG